MTRAEPAFILNQPPRAWKGSERTLVIVGLARGGTSMVAAVLHHLGVDMGRPRKATFEDPDFSVLLNRVLAARLAGPLEAAEARAQSLEQARRLIDRRNRESGVWGWKFPGLVLPEIYQWLRNPGFLVVERDPVAVTARRVASEGAEAGRTYHATLEELAGMHRFVSGLEHPVMLISYEKALARPAALVDQVIEFCGLQPASERRTRAIESIRPSPDAYLDDTRAVAVHGNLDGVFETSLCGWVAWLEEPLVDLDIEIRVDGEYRLTGRADLPRPDVQRHLAQLRPAGPVDDRHGFVVRIPEHLLDGGRHRVEVIVTGHDDYRIGNSPALIDFPTSADTSR